MVGGEQALNREIATGRDQAVGFGQRGIGRGKLKGAIKPRDHARLRV